MNHLVSDQDSCDWPMRRFPSAASFYIGNPRIVIIEKRIQKIL